MASTVRPNNETEIFANNSNDAHDRDEDGTDAAGQVGGAANVDDDFIENARDDAEEWESLPQPIRVARAPRERSKKRS